MVSNNAATRGSYWSNTLSVAQPWWSQLIKPAFISFKDVSSCAFWTSSKIDCLTELFFKISHRFKGAEATWQKNFGQKIYFFFSNRYLCCIRALCEKFFQIVCLVPEKSGKQIQTCDKICVASIRSCLPIEWNQKCLSSAILSLRDRLLIAPWHGFHLLQKGL